MRFGKPIIMDSYESTPCASCPQSPLPKLRTSPNLRTKRSSRLVA